MVKRIRADSRLMMNTVKDYNSTGRLRLAFMLSVVLLLNGVSGLEVRGESRIDLLADYTLRLNKLKQDDYKGQYELAQWCIKKGMPLKAMETYRRLLMLNPEHDDAYDALLHLASNTRLPELDARRENLLEEFPGFKSHLTRHFLIIYNTDQTWALNRAVLLEKTYERYFTSFREFGLRPLPVHGRMICILFEDHEQYVAYAKRVDGQNMGWSGGYYSGRTNRVAFFNDKNSPMFKEINTKIESLDKQVNELRENIQKASRARKQTQVVQLREELNKASRHLAFYRNRLNALAGMANVSKTTHEAAHQIAYNTMMQKRGVVYPFWLSEGFATNFEAYEAGALFGPQIDNASRRQMLIDLRAKKQLTPLRKLVTMTHVPPNEKQEVIAGWYAEAWAFYRFLLYHQRVNLEKYYREMATGMHRRHDPESLLKVFENSFGDVDELDRLWRNYLKNLRAQ